MSPFDLAMISVGLAMDAFAVAIATGMGLRRVTARHVFRLSFHFGLFQALMPVVGYLMGTALANSIQTYSHWVAFGLLAFVGGKMLWESRQSGHDQVAGDRDPTRGLSLVMLSIATSLDALAVGLSLAIAGLSVVWPAVVIGAVACGLTGVGIGFGHRLGGRWARYAESLGGIILILIGARILATGFVCSY